MTANLLRTLPAREKPPTKAQLAYCRDNPDQLCVADFTRLRQTFVTLDVALASRIGHPFDVLFSRFGPPIYRIRFGDGVEIDAYSAEVCERCDYGAAPSP